MAEDKGYKDGDIVWVKLGNNWWPGEVIDPQRHPDDLEDDVKRKLICIVKFFNENAYEYVTNVKQVHPFQCPKKTEFLKKGFSLLKNGNKFMEKFPEDVKIAERMTRNKEPSLIYNDRPDSIVKAMLGPPLVSSVETESYGNSNSREKRKSGESITKIMNITPYKPTPPQITPAQMRMEQVVVPNTLNTNNRNEIRTSISGDSARRNSGASSTPISNNYHCNMCDFTSMRQNVMILHRKTHSSIRNNANSGPSAVRNNTSIIRTHIDTTLSNTKVPTATAVSVKVAPTATAGPQQKYSPAPAVASKTSLTVAKVLLSPHESEPSPEANEATKRRLSSSSKDNVISNGSTVDIDLPDPKPIKKLPKKRNFVDHNVNNKSLQDEKVTSAALKVQKETETEATASSPEANKTKTSPVVEDVEEIRKMLLEDWSDDDETQENENRNECDNNKRKNNNTLKDAESPSKSTAASATSPTTSPNIRNIPKKDRRNAADNESSGEQVAVINVDDDVVHVIDNSNSSVAEVVADDENTIITIADEDSNKLDSSNSETCEKMAELHEKNVEVNVSSVSAAVASCFDFQTTDDEEDGDDTNPITAEYGASMSIAHFKKKYLASDKPQTCNEDNPSPQAQLNEDIAQKDQQLADEIEKLLATTQLPPPDLLAPSKTVEERISVKDLPIKERGKRIFKSRNHSRVADKSGRVASEEDNNTKDTAPKRILSRGREMARKALMEKQAADMNHNRGSVTPIPEQSTIESEANCDLNGKKSSSNATGKTVAEESDVQVTGVQVNPKENISSDKVVAQEIKNQVLNVQPMDSGPNENEKCEEDGNDKNSFAPAALSDEINLDDKSAEKQGSICADNSNDIEDFSQLNPTDVKNLFSDKAPHKTVTPENNGIANKSPTPGKNNEALASTLNAPKVAESITSEPSNSVTVAENKGTSRDTSASDRVLTTTPPTDENSSMCASDTGAEFGSPTSMLSDERLPTFPFSRNETPPSEIAVKTHSDFNGDANKPASDHAKSDLVLDGKPTKVDNNANMAGNNKQKSADSKPLSICQKKTSLNVSKESVGFTKKLQTLHRKNEERVLKRRSDGRDAILSTPNAKDTAGEDSTTSGTKRKIEIGKTTTDRGAQEIKSNAADDKLVNKTSTVLQIDANAIAENSAKKCDITNVPKQKDSASKALRGEATDCKSIREKHLFTGNKNNRKDIGFERCTDVDIAQIDLSEKSRNCTIDNEMPAQPDNEGQDRTDNRKKEQYRNENVKKRVNDNKGKEELNHREIGKKPKLTPVTDTQEKVLNKSKSPNLAQLKDKDIYSFAGKEEGDSIKDCPALNEANTKEYGSNRTVSPSSASESKTSETENYNCWIAEDAIVEDNENSLPEKDIIEYDPETPVTPLMSECEEPLEIDPHTLLVASSENCDQLSRLANDCSERASNKDRLIEFDNLVNQKAESLVANRAIEPAKRSEPIKWKTEHTKVVTSQPKDDVLFKQKVGIKRRKTICSELSEVGLMVGESSRKRIVIDFEDALPLEAFSKRTAQRKMTMPDYNSQFKSFKPRRRSSIEENVKITLAKSKRAEDASDLLYGKSSELAARQIGVDSKGNKYIVIRDTSPPQSMRTQHRSDSNDSPMTQRNGRALKRKASQSRTTPTLNNTKTALAVSNRRLSLQPDNTTQSKLPSSVAGCVAIKPKITRDEVINSLNENQLSTAQQQLMQLQQQQQQQQQVQLSSTMLNKQNRTRKTHRSQLTNSNTTQVVQVQQIQPASLIQPQAQQTQPVVTQLANQQNVLQLVPSQVAQSNPTTADGFIITTTSSTEDDNVIDSNSQLIALPTQPYPGYTETFLLCKVKGNTCKPVDNVPLYLNHQLNELVPIPLEVLEGTPKLATNQDGTIDIKQGNTTIQQLQIEDKVEPQLSIATDRIPGADTSDGDAALTHEYIQASADGAINNTNPFGATDEEVTTDSSANNGILLTIEGQQVLLDAATFQHLLSNPDANTQLISEDGTEYVLTHEVLQALHMQQQEQQQVLSLANVAGVNNDIIAVAMAGSDLYGNGVLTIDTSLVEGTGGLVFQQPPAALVQQHLTPPAVVTNAVLDQSPIMSTLEVPSCNRIQLPQCITVPSLPTSATNVILDGNTHANLEDSLAAIGVTTQASTMSSSLGLPITVTDPNIASKVTSADPLNEMLQFVSQRPATAAATAAAVAAAALAGESRIFND